MPQSDNLLPWRSVLDNTILGLEVEGVVRKQARVQATQLCERFGLGGFLKSYPRELSGGMRQRAAFIRTMLFPRDVLLLDEPLGALDAQTRLLMQEWLLDVWSEWRKTVLFITHDVDEAVFLADRVYVMSARPGRIVDEVAITLARPRDAEIRLADEFVQLRNHLLERIRGETLKSFERGDQ
jgi:ABC-type nitrate/sulfonate/bicarbonate transport system ATPase subunit